MCDDARSDATFRFDVHNIQLLKSLLSPPCYIRNLPWKILVRSAMFFNSPTLEPYPQKKYLGVFLQCNGESKSVQWTCRAKAILRLIPHKPDSKVYSREVHHLFDSAQHNNGYEKFMSYDDLMDPERGFENDGTITVEVEVSADEPQGITREPFTYVSDSEQESSSEEEEEDEDEDEDDIINEGHTITEAKFRYVISNISELHTYALSPPCYVNSLPYKIMAFPHQAPEAPCEAPNEAPNEVPPEAPSEAPHKAPREAPSETSSEEAPPETPSKDAPRETPSEDAPRETLKETSSEVPREAPRETPSKDAPRETPSEEAPRETLKETSSEVPREVPRETPSKDAPRETPSEDAPREILKETYSEVPREVHRETPSKDAPRETPSEDAPRETLKETSSEVPREAPRETPSKDVPRETPSEEAPRELPNEDAPRETLKENSSEVPREAPLETPTKDAPREIPSEEAPRETSSEEAPREAGILPRRDALSLFLQCKVRRSHVTWSCFTAAELSIISHKPDTPPLSKRLFRLFHRSASSWGYNSFISWDDLMDPENGYVKDGDVTLEVHVIAVGPYGY